MPPRASASGTTPGWRRVAAPIVPRRQLPNRAKAARAGFSLRPSSCPWPAMPALELGVVACLIVLNGFFALAELALVPSRRPRLAAMAEKGSAGARAALRLLD